MCFNVLNRLAWLALVFVAALFVIGLGLLTYISGAVELGPREAVILAGGLVAEIGIVVAYFRLHTRRFRRPSTRAVPPPPVPWYDAPRNLSQKIYEPPIQAEATPPHPARPVIVHAGKREADNDHGDTRPMRRVEVPRLQSEVEEDTKPTKAVRLPVIPPKKPPPGPYDDLFPPAQPGDEDYLETSHMEPIPEQPEQPPAAEAEIAPAPSADEEAPPEPPSEEAEQTSPDGPAS
jgi:hypothetical protein